MFGLTLSKYGYMYFIAWVVISIIVGVIVWFYLNQNYWKNARKVGIIVFIILLIIGYVYAYFES